MSRIIRTDANQVLAKVVEYHGFVYTQGVVASDTSKGITEQTQDVLAQIDTLLEIHGTDKTRLLQAHIWLKDIADREAMNAVWSAWLPEGGAPARACVQAVMADPGYLVEIMVTACR
jgi:enamine deaminase RidA (YjgF/YER057c/UK114 family)